jgi:hypothetical protein
MGARKQVKPRLGRPPKPAGERRRNPVTFTVTDADLEGLRALASERGISVSSVVYSAVAKLLRGRR